MASPSRLLLCARRVYTTGFSPIEHGALIIEQGKILAVGEKQLLLDRFRRNLETVDLADCVLLPSFVDAHLHLTELLRQLSGVDLSQARTRQEVVGLLQQGVNELAAGSGEEWLMGFGLDRLRFEGFGGCPRELLDQIAGTRPAVVFSLDLHTLWASTQAQKQAGVTSTVGQFVDSESSPLRKQLPMPRGARFKKALDRVALRLLRAGITRVADFSGLRLHQQLLQLQQQKALPLHFTTTIFLNEWDEALATGFCSGKRQDRICCGFLKLFADGSLGSKTAWMLEPYLLSGQDRGLAMYRQEELSAIVKEAHRLGIRVALHAIGDAAVRMAASVLGPQDRIEHAQHVHQNDLTLLAKAGCSACVNPSHMEIDWQAAEQMLPNQGRGSYPLASLLGAGVPLVFGSDAPVAEANPLHAMMWAVQRADQQGLPHGGWQPQERILTAQALAASTHLAANACLADGAHAIAQGRPADLVALDGDPFEAPPEQWPQIQAKQVWLEGQSVFEA